MNKSDANIFGMFEETAWWMASLEDIAKNMDKKEMDIYTDVKFLHLQYKQPKG